MAFALRGLLRGLLLNLSEAGANAIRPYSFSRSLGECHSPIPPPKFDTISASTISRHILGAIF